MSRLERFRRVSVPIERSPRLRTPKLGGEVIVYTSKPRLVLAADKVGPQRRVISSRVADEEREEEYRPDLAKLQSEDAAVQQREWEEWYRYLDPKLKRYAIGRVYSRERAEDLVGDTWRKLHEVIERGKVVDNNLNGLAITTLKRTIIDHTRVAETRRTAVTDPEILARDVDRSASVTIEDTVFQTEDRTALMGAIAQLSQLHREQIEAYLAETPLEAIAAKLGIRVDAVKGRRYRAMQALKTVLEKGQAAKPAPEDKAEREKREREERWFGTIYNSPLDRGLRYLMLTEKGLQQIQFAALSGLDSTSIRLLSQGKIGSLIDLEPLLKLNLLDPLGKTAQMIRLRLQGKKLPDRKDLERYTTGELVEYIRIGLGLTKRDLSKKTKIAVKSIYELEVNKLEPQSQERVQGYISLIIHHLKLSPDEPLVKLLQSKANGDAVTISSEDYQKLLAGRFVVDDPSQKKDHPVLSDEDKSFLRTNKKRNNFGQSLVALRQYRNMSQKDLAQASKISKGQISHFENGVTLPQDYNVFKVVKGFGYDFHHPLTHYLFEALDTNRLDRHKTGKTKK